VDACACIIYREIGELGWTHTHTHTHTHCSGIRDFTISENVWKFSALSGGVGIEIRDPGNVSTQAEP